MRVFSSAPTQAPLFRILRTVLLSPIIECEREFQARLREAEESQLYTGDVNPLAILFHPTGECGESSDQETGPYRALGALPAIPFFRPRATIASSSVLFRCGVGKSRR